MARCASDGGLFEHLLMNMMQADGRKLSKSEASPGWDFWRLETGAILDLTH